MGPVDRDMGKPLEVNEVLTEEMFVDITDVERLGICTIAK